MPDVETPILKDRTDEKGPWQVWVRRPFIGFLAAAQFLTVSPVFVQRFFTPAELGRSVGYYPLVGLLLGALLAALDAGLAAVFSPSVATALVLVAWVLATGALHLDGFLDSCDGLLGGHSPERRLEIMRDERVGAFGLAGGVLLLLLKYAALGTLTFPGGMLSRAAALILVPTLGRWGMVLAVWAFPYGRTQGLGRAIKDHTGGGEVVLATILAAAPAGVLGGWLGLGALAVAAATSWGVARFTLARLPGLTGDVYGAICEVTEAATLLLFALKPI